MWLDVPALGRHLTLILTSLPLLAAEYIHHLKDGHLERGSKVAELRREIECLSAEIQ